MNLAERSGNLLAQLKKLEQTKGLASQAIHFEKRAEELATASGDLLPISKTFGLLKNLKIEFKALSELSLSDWNFRFTDLRDKYALDPQFILNPAPGEDARAVFLNPLKQLPSKIRAAMTVEWSSWASQQIPQINDELIGVLSAVASTKTKAEKLRALRRAALEAGNRLPNSQTEVDRFLANIKGIRQAWEDLAGDGIPKEVIDFLRVAGRNEGAKFNQLTPSILEWLREHHLDQTLHIRMS